MAKKITCIVCKGKGKVNAPAHRRKKMKGQIVMAKSLQKRGYSVREIMRMMEYKSPRSVSILLQ